MRRFILPAFALLAVLGTGVPGCAQDVPSGASSGAETPLLDSARAELRAGRPWHLTRLLAPRAATLGSEGRLLLARGEAGWGHWSAVDALLEDAPWLDAVDGGDGWRLLGRAREDAEAWAPAADAYARWLGSPAGRSDTLALAVAARRARVLWRAGDSARALAGLDSVAAADAVVASWTAADLARVPADGGRPDAVRALLARVDDAEARAGAWDLLPRALLEAGDSAAARMAFASAAEEVTGSRRAEARDRQAALALAARDTAAARRVSLDALAAASRSPGAASAADRLLAIGGLDAGTAVLAGEALDRAGKDARALQAYDLHVKLEGGVAEVSPRVRLDRARLMATTSGRQDGAVEEFRVLSTNPDERVGAVALDAWADLRRRQGRSGDVATIQKWLVERYPGSREATRLVFFRGDAAHDRRDYPEALRQYGAVAEMAPTRDEAGLARMRMAQIHLLRDEPREALKTFESYLADFPEGRRWQEASYWAARTDLALGDSARARAHLARIRKEDPLGYYAVLAADVEGEPYTLDLPPGEEPGLPTALAGGLRRLDVLTAAGLEDGADVEVGRLVARSRTDRDAMLRLAEELVARGETIPGINLVWALRARGEPWTLRLARAAYPFPFRQAVLREASEDGADPWWLVAIIRQESAFDPSIVSGAGAVGLMQLLPVTARTLARSIGPKDFTADALTEPDVNLHLGTRYFQENLARYDSIIPLVLSAYNAGPDRADAWKHFPEARDWTRFVERIPFGETRDYVRQVTRNHALYQALWGDVVEDSRH